MASEPAHSDTPPLRSSSHGQWLVLALALLVYLAAVRPFYGLTADDAFISFRYAQSWAAGCGPVYSCGETPVEGYTNFLWMALAALSIAVGADVVQVMRLLGLLCGFAALAAALLLCRRLHRRPAAQLVVVAGMAASPFWAANAVTGLETAAATLSVLVAATLSLDLPGRKRAWAAGVAWGVSYLLRPEAAGFAALTGLWSLGAGLLGRLGLRQTLRGTLLYGVGFLAVAAPYFTWRVLYYGDLFPNTFHAKQDDLWLLISRNLALLGSHWLHFAPVLVIALAVLVLQRRARLLYLVLLALGSALISLSVHNNFWMPGHRLYLTAVTLLLVVAAGVVELDGSRWEGKPAWRRAGLVALALACAPLVLAGWAYFPATQELAQLHYATDDNPARKMGLHIRRLARPGDWLAIRDAGMVPFFAGPGVKVLDMHEKSLNDRHITWSGWKVGYVMGRKPRFIVFASPFERTLPVSSPICQAQGIPVSRLLGGKDESHCVVFAHLQGWLLARSAQFRDGRYRQAMKVPWHRLRYFMLFQRDQHHSSGKPSPKQSTKTPGKRH